MHQWSIDQELQLAHGDPTRDDSPRLIVGLMVTVRSPTAKYNISTSLGMRLLLDVNEERLVHASHAARSALVEALDATVPTLAWAGMTLTLNGRRVQFVRAAATDSYWVAFRIVGTLAVCVRAQRWTAQGSPALVSVSLGPYLDGTRRLYAE